MSKKNKVIITICIAIMLLLVLPFVAFQIYINTYIFENSNVCNITTHSNDEEFIESERLISEGYIINAPSFHSRTDFNLEGQATVYAPINNTAIDYAFEVAKKYDNYAKLDYTLENFDNKITIDFYGYGYYYDDREPDVLQKTFVFDISNVSPKNPPRLISEM